MMNNDIALRTIVIYGMWTASGALITTGWLTSTPSIGQYGLMATAIGATMTVVRDNGRTRRIVRRRTNERTAQRSDPG